MRGSHHASLAPHFFVVLLALSIACASASTGAPLSGERPPPSLPDPGAPPAAPSVSMPSSLSSAPVAEVSDGDTLDVLLDGQTVTLRLIGLDTPETRDPRKPVQSFGREASNRARQFLDGQTVFLEADSTQGDWDRYNRLLRYVWLSDGRLYNLEMIAQGFAHEYTYNVPYRYQKEFKAAEERAREAGVGFWSPNTCAGDTEQAAPEGEFPVEPPEEVPQPTVAPPRQQPGGSACDPSYPDVCIPSPPPDLNCGDVRERGFRVVGADPHGFDRNGDGVGCEG